MESKKGRPTEDIYEKYVKGRENSIMSWCRNGADNEIISKKLGCGKTTLSKLIKNYPQFKKIIKESKEDADLAVESALYKRALGFDFEETTTKVILSKDGTSGTTTEVSKTKKHIAPDTTAGIYWLKNRRPEAWRDKHEVELMTNPFLELMKAVADKDGN